jgi:predicted nucleotidyltransferase
MLALIVMFLVLIVLGLRGVRGRGPTQTDGRPRMSAMQSAGLSGLVIAGLFAVDRLLSHYQEAMNVVLILLGPTTPAERAAGFEELMETSEGIVTLFGAGAMLTICLIVFGVGLWRASGRHAPTALFTWTSRAALVVALAGSIWHTTAAFAVVRDVERLVEWVETMRRTPQRRSPGSRVLGPGAGVLVMGSWIRGDGGASSDIDVLIAVDPAVALTRDLYRAWDREPLAWNGRAIDVHVTHLADPAAAPTAVWCEAAIDGVVWFERNGAVARRLGAIRRAIAEGRVVRAVAHGQPYWKGAA